MQLIQFSDVAGFSVDLTGKSLGPRFCARFLSVLQGKTSTAEARQWSHVFSNILSLKLARNTVSANAIR